MPPKKPPKKASQIDVPLDARVAVLKWKLTEEFKRKLAGADNIHDFNDRGGRVPLSCWDSVSNNLLIYLKSLWPGSSGSNFNGWLHSIYTTVSASEVEEQTIIWYENQFPLELRTNTRRTMTYREIVGQPVSIVNGVDILELNVGKLENWNKNYSETEKKQIGLFILDFFFPPTGDTALNSRQKTYISFDAGSHMPDSIFGKMDQVINLVTALNIADSAKTETHLNGKNYYRFQPTEGDYYVYDSNIYSKDRFKIKLKPNRAIYDRDGRYDFKIHIEDLSKRGGGINYDFLRNKPITPAKISGGKVVLKKKEQLVTSGQPEIDFDEKHSSGPSVKYLSQSIDLTVKGKSINEGEGMVSISKLKILINPSNIEKDKEWLIKLLFDLKRSGDWEQANAVNLIDKMNDPLNPCRSRTIFATIDRLCSLYSRCLSQNTIYHYNTSLILYRFKSVPLTPFDGAINQVLEIKEKLQSIDALNTKIDEFKSGLDTSLSIPETENPNTSRFKCKSNINIERILTYVAIELLKKSKDEIERITKTESKIVLPNRAEIDSLIGIDVSTLTNAVKKADYIAKATKINEQMQGISLDYFDKISIVFGESVTLTNYAKYASSIKIPIKLNQFTDGHYCLYDGKVLDSIKLLFINILSYDTGRITGQKDRVNYRDEYEKKGIFEIITSLIHKLSGKELIYFDKKDITSFSDINDQICFWLYHIVTQEYTEVSDGSYGEANAAYHISLKAHIREITALIPSLIVGGASFHVREESFSSDYIDNLEKSIQSQLLSEFITLTNLFTSTTDKLLSGYEFEDDDSAGTPIDLAINPLDFNNFKDLIFSIEISDEIKSEILENMINYITNVCDYFNKLFETIDLLQIDKEDNDYKHNRKKYYKKIFENADLKKIYHSISNFIAICFLFGMFLKLSGYEINYSEGDRNPNIVFDKELLKDTRTSALVENKNQFFIYISNIFELFFDYFDGSLSVNDFRYIIDIFTNTFISTASENFTKLQFLIHYIFTHDYDPCKLFIIYFSVFNRLFIDNILLCNGVSEESAIESGYYSRVLSIETIRKKRITTVNLESLHSQFIQICNGRSTSLDSRYYRVVTGEEKIFKSNLLVYNFNIPIVLGITDFINHPEYLNKKLLTTEVLTPESLGGKSHKITRKYIHNIKNYSKNHNKKYNKKYTKKISNKLIRKTIKY